MKKITKLYGSLIVSLFSMSFFAMGSEVIVIEGSTIASGGGKSTGGIYAISGTISQPDAGTCSGTSLTLAGGFWPGALAEVGPVLEIVSSGGSVIISWPASATGFSLQYCTDLGRKNWVNDTTPALLFGTDKVVVESAHGIRFYRLIKP